MPDNLALSYEEVFTAIDRLNGGRQAVSDSGAFRQQIRDAIGQAERTARSAAYSPEDIRLATFAVVALLDAAILRLQSPVFHDWPKKPMGEEFFGSFNAGETFFTNIQRLLRNNDTPQLADLLEVYQLCILLGFQGRHGVSSQGELRAIREAIAERIRRIRGEQRPLAPFSKPPAGTRRNAGDPWLKGLLWSAVGLCVLTVLLFLLYSLRLHSGVSDLAAPSTNSRTTDSGHIESRTTPQTGSALRAASSVELVFPLMPHLAACALEGRS